MNVTNRAGNSDVRSASSASVNAASIQLEPGDTPVQLNHSHPGTTASTHPSNKDAVSMFSQGTPPFPITTYNPFNDTLNVMWFNEQGIPQQFYIPLR